MRRHRMFGLVAIVLAAAACTGGTSPAPRQSASGQAASSGAPAASGAAAGAPSVGGSLVDNAAKVTDVCSLLPIDLVAKLVPDAREPQSQTFPPLNCTVSNGANVVVVTLGARDTGARDAGQGTEPVPGLGAGARVEQLGPGDTFLTVFLTPDTGTLNVEITDPSGTAHTNYAVEIAQRILAGLQ